MRGIGRALTVSTIIGLITAVAVLIFMEKPAAYLAALVLLVLPVGVYLLLQQFFRNEGLVEHGQPAEATVLEMWDTGWTINQNPQVGLRLQVRPPVGPPYEAQTKAVISRLMIGQLRPGVVLQVYYDPAKPQRVAVDFDAGIRGAPSEAAERLSELESLHEQGLITEEEYERKRREIVDGL